MFDALQNEQGERLDCAFHDAGSSSLIVIGHGVTANKDRAFLVALADGLQAAGISSLRFSFSGNGDSEGDFRESTISKEVADLGAVFDRLDRFRVGFVGHSMGGAVGVLRASSDSRIQCLVSLAGMVATAQFAQRKFGELTAGQDLMWDKPECPLSQLFLDDMARIDSVVALGARIEIPWLLIHGREDSVVPLADSQAIFEQAPMPKELHILDDTDHLFSGDATARMVAQVVPWIGAVFA